MNIILKDIKLVCFDLDGTLMNSYDTIYKATIKTMEHLDIRGEIREPEFYKLIGHHFFDIFRDLNIDVPDIEHFINIYKSYYFDFIDESKVYPGVVEFLSYLKKNNIKVALLTTKGQDQADKIIEHFNLSKYFDYIVGRREGLPVKPSPEPLLFICNHLNVTPAKTLMTGDTELDVRCGKAAGSKTCAVTFGFRTKEALKLEKPDYIIDHYKELFLF